MDQAVMQAINEIADEFSLDAEALAAIVEVESGGRLFARVAGRDEPLIRFEGHYFYRLLPTAKRKRAVVAGLAHRLAGHVRNPSGQVARWKRLRKASEIDRPSALESTSWGVGQVMGAHWRWLDHASVDALVAEARSGASGQIRLMARFIAKAGLKSSLEQHDWAGFAQAYNGPGYRTNRYDSKIAAAFARHAGLARPSPGRHSAPVLRLGSHGDDVEQFQHALRRMGYPLIADGDFGPATRAAVLVFQRANGLEADGAIGAATLAAMHRHLPQSAIGANRSAPFQSI